MKKIINIVFLLSIMIIASSLSACQNKDGISKNEEYSIPEEAIELQAEIAEVYNDADAIVTVISDDGVYYSCVNLNDIFAERGLKCTVAGAISNIEPYKSEWDELLKSGTINIVSHSYDHIRMEDGSEIAEDEEALKHEIVDADKWYENWLGNEQITFVCPENQMCEKGYKILEENGFWAVRKGHRGYNSLSPEDGTADGQWFSLMVQGICDEGVDTQTRNEWIDTAINDKVWLIEMWHNVMPGDDGCYQTILIADAEEHLDYMVQKSSLNDIWVATFDEAVKYIREKQNAELKAYLYEDTLYISVNLTNTDMSLETFNQPLTVKIELPDYYVLNSTEDYSIADNVLEINIIPGEMEIIELDRK